MAASAEVSKATPSPRFTDAFNSTAMASFEIPHTWPINTPRFALLVPGTSILWSQPLSQPGENPREKVSSISSICFASKITECPETAESMA